MKIMLISIWALTLLGTSAKSVSNSETVKVYYIVPENIATDVECQQIECHTLTYYMNYSIGSPSHYFRSYESYIFWSGVHNPLKNATVIMSNVSNLTFIGNGAIIDCNSKSVGFVFRHSVNITLQDLDFMSCTRHHFNYIPATLVFIDGFDLTLSNIKLWGSVYGAIFIKDTLGLVHLEELTVANSNTAGQELPHVESTIIYKHCFNQTPHLTIKDSTFINNSNLAKSTVDNQMPATIPFAGGLTIHLECRSIDVKIINLTMRNNTGGDGGNLALLFGKNTCGNVKVLSSHFESGYSMEGSGLYTDFNTRESLAEHTMCSPCQEPGGLLQVINSTFIDNVVQYAGSGVYIIHRQLDTVCGMKKVELTNCTFVNNSVIKSGFGGIALHSINIVMTNYILHSNPQLQIELDSCEFKNNHMIHTNIPSGGTGVVFTKSNFHFQLSNTAISHNTCSGILAVSSNLILSGNITITNNKAASGGGLLLCENAVMYLEEFVKVTIAHNTVDHAGGGITVERRCLQSKPMCFFQLGKNVLVNLSFVETINVNMFNNSAKFAGDNLFGGSVEYCYIISGTTSSYHLNNTNIFRVIFNVSKSSPSWIASPPQRVCLCLNSTVDCDTNMSRNYKKFPGETFDIEAVLVGQLNGLVPGAVRAHLTDSVHNESSDNFVHKIQRIDQKSCKTLEYTVYSDQPHLLLQLGVQYSGDVSGFEQLKQFRKLDINITIKPCPVGFTLRNNSNGLHCGCNDGFEFRAKSGEITCDIKKQWIVKHDRNIWIGLTETNSVAFHAHCPFDYCNTNPYIKATNESLYQDSQCANHRTGIICGACSDGFSLVLGGTECRHCSNYWLLLYIFFACLGIVLIFLLTVFNWTISGGTFGGIIFYCNIIKSNIISYFPEINIPVLTPLLKMFVSLINLESSEPMCLYNGMDAYWHAWLRFFLPVYMLVVAGVFICLGSRCSWIVRRNAVKVLATLVLLSYTKLLYVVIEDVHVTYLYVDRTYEIRWLLDGNVKYFTGKHIPLVIAASIFGLLLLPFTFCLLCIQCLQKASHHSMFSWVNRLKPFFDAYTGPFTSAARFWTGLLLLVRAIVFIFSAANIAGDPKLNLGVITLAVLLLLSIALMLPRGLYERRCLNILECWLLLNLGILSTATSYAMTIHHKKTYTSVALSVTYLCIGSAFITFIGIALYHTCRIKPIKKCLRYIQFHLVRRYFSRVNQIEAEDNEIQEPMAQLVPLFDHEREPLI